MVASSKSKIFRYETNITAVLKYHKYRYVGAIKGFANTKKVVILIVIYEFHPNFARPQDIVVRSVIKLTSYDFYKRLRT